MTKATKPLGRYAAEIAQLRDTTTELLNALAAARLRVERAAETQTNPTSSARDVAAALRAEITGRQECRALAEAVEQREIQIDALARAAGEELATFARERTAPLAREFDAAVARLRQEILAVVRHSEALGSLVRIVGTWQAIAAATNTEYPRTDFVERVKSTLVSIASQLKGADLELPIVDTSDLRAELARECGDVARLLVDVEKSRRPAPRPVRASIEPSIPEQAQA